MRIGTPNRKLVGGGAGALAHLVVLLILFIQPATAQQMVPVPKSRLEELERKEAELQRLKAEQNKVRDQSVQPQHPTQAPAPKDRAAAPASAAVPSTPPLSSLPPLKEGSVVEARDLAAHYVADAAAADQRYRNRSFKLRGEIERFEKPLLIRDYRIVFKGADRQVMVICNVFPPESFKAVFTVKNGSELVGLTPDERRVPIARVGGIAMVQGRCKGLSNGVVKLTGSALVPPS